MPDGVQSLPVVLNQTPAVEKFQEVDLRQFQVLQQVAAAADQERVARSQARVETSEQTRAGRRVSAEGGRGGPGAAGGRAPGERERKKAPAAPAGGKPPGGIVDVVV
ncbi:MAG: hypothetical protein KJ621_20120 [Proteobacteria bacterium]|nr:hypothetical protein [Pseudomonadota bacterium]